MVGALLVGSVSSAAAFPVIRVSSLQIKNENAGGEGKRAYELNELMDDIDSLSDEEAIRNYSVLFEMQNAFKQSDATKDEDQILTNQICVLTRFRLRCGNSCDDVLKAVEGLSRRIMETGRLQDLLYILDDHFYVPSDGNIVRLAYALILSRHFVIFSRYFHRYCVRCDLAGGAEGSIVEIMKRVIAIFCEYTLDDPEMPKARFVDSLMRSVCAYHARLVTAGYDAAAAESMSLLGQMEECQIVSWVDCFPMFEEASPLHDEFPYAADDAYRIAESVHTDGDMLRIEDVSSELCSGGTNRLLYLNTLWEEYHKYSRLGTLPSGPSGSAYHDVMSSLSYHMARGVDMGGNVSGTSVAYSGDDADDLSPPGEGRGARGVGSDGRRSSVSRDALTIELEDTGDSDDSDGAFYDDEDDDYGSSDFYDDSEEEEYEEDEEGHDEDDGIVLDSESGYDAAENAREALESLVETAKTMASELSAAEEDGVISGAMKDGATRRGRSTIGITLGVNVTPQGISISPMSTSSLLRRLGRGRSVPTFRGGAEAVRRRMLLARMDQLGMASAFDYYPSSAPMPIHDVTSELACIDPAYRMEFAEAIIR
jgi:hypothetical protein